MWKDGGIKMAIMMQARAQAAGVRNSIKQSTELEETIAIHRELQLVYDPNEIRPFINEMINEEWPWKVYQWEPKIRKLYCGKTDSISSAWFTVIFSLHSDKQTYNGTILPTGQHAINLTRAETDLFLELGRKLENHRQAKFRVLAKQKIEEYNKVIRNSLKVS